MKRMSVGVLLLLFLGGCGPEREREAILEQIQAHHYLWDARELEACGELFTEDAVTQVYATGGTEALWRSPDLTTLLQASRSYLGGLEGIQTRHHPTGIQFLELGGDRATTRHTVLVTHAAEDGRKVEVSASGTYTMQWIRTREGWRIRQRDFYRD